MDVNPLIMVAAAIIVLQSIIMIDVFGNGPLSRPRWCAICILLAALDDTALHLLRSALLI